MVVFHVSTFILLLQSVKKLSKRPVCGIIKETGVLLWNNGKKIREAKF